MLPVAQYDLRTYDDAVKRYGDQQKPCFPGGLHIGDYYEVRNR